jgi:hypothetical protein
LIANRSDGRVEDRGIRVEYGHHDGDCWLEPEGRSFGAMTVDVSAGRRVEPVHPVGISRFGNTMACSLPLEELAKAPHRAPQAGCLHDEITDTTANLHAYSNTARSPRSIGEAVNTKSNAGVTMAFGGK